MCVLTSRDGSCPTGNPVYAGTGRKLETEVLSDSFFGGLSYVRRHLAQDLRWSGFGPDPRLMDTEWNAAVSFDLRAALSVNSGTGERRAFISRPDAAVLPFASASATAAWTTNANSNARFVDVRDGGGVITGYTLYDDAANVIESYDTLGRMTQVADAQGRTYQFVRTNPFPTLDEAAVQPTAIVDQFGRTLAIQYSAPGRISKIIEPDGAERSYTYDAFGRVSQITYPGGLKRVYHYNEPAHTGGANLPAALTGISDEIAAGNLVRYGTYKYDGQGRAISSEHAGGVDRYQFNYVSSNVQTVVTDPLGTQRTRNFSTILGVVKQTSATQPAGAGSSACSDSFTYDANGNVTRRTDFNGNASCYAIDSARNLETARVEGLGSGASCPADLTNYVPAANTAQRKILTQWHPDWRLEVRRAEPKKITTSVYNGQVDPTTGSVVTCAPGSAQVDGKPIAVLCRKIEQATSDDTGAQGFGATPVGAPRIWNTTYNPFGQVLTEDGPRTDVADLTTYEYYATTTADYTLGDLKQVTNALGQVTQYTQYNGRGQVLRQIDANGTVTDTAYHPRGWVSQVTVTPAGAAAQVTTYQYDGVGQLTQLTPPDGGAITYTYDDARRLTRVTDAAGNRIVYTLDAAGNRTREDVEDGSGTLVRRLTRALDALGRVQSVSYGP